MPNKQAAMKALRQTKKRTQQNTILKRTLTNLIKEAMKAIEAKDKTKATELAQKVQQLIDKAAKNNVLPKNTANRKKSAVMTKINSL